ncbi:MAG: hypothetical protein JWR69_705 [Pedosphaera sp.]|nr:hypothetical protein [Pedosphaera sp.]
MSDEKLRETATKAYHAGEQQSPCAALADELYRERVVRARHTPPEQKVLAGQRLFESACLITLAGIRNQFPGQPEERYQEIPRERLALRRRRQG